MRCSSLSEHADLPHMMRVRSGRIQPRAETFAALQWGSVLTPDAIADSPTLLSLPVPGIALHYDARPGGGVIRRLRWARMAPLSCGQGSRGRGRGVGRWAWLGGWPADHFDEAEDDQQQDGDHNDDGGGRLAPEDEDQRGQRDRPDP